MPEQKPTITDSAHDLAAALDQIAKLCAARGVDLVLRRDDATETWTASAEGIGAGEYWEGAYTPLPAETLMSLHEQMVQWPNLGPCLKPTEVGAQVQAARREGAEAMQEAALAVVANVYPVTNGATREWRKARDAIRALPLPGDDA